MKLNICKNYQPIDIKIIEKKYKSKYLGDFCVKRKNGWSEQPYAIFYQPNPDVSLGHSHYFGMFVNNGKLYITKGDSAFEEGLTGVVANDGEIVISCYRHDYRTSTDDSVFIDGGRDYIRSSVGCEFMKLNVVNGEFVKV